MTSAPEPPEDSGEPVPEVGRWIFLGLLGFPLLAWGLVARLGFPLTDAVFTAGLLELLPVLAVAQLPLVGNARVERVPAYLASAATLVVLGISAAALGARRGGMGGLGLGPVPMSTFAAWTAAVCAAASAVVLLLHLLRRRLGIRESPILAELLPVTPREKGIFVVLSLAAGLGEELAFRGYALPVLSPHLGGAWGAAGFTSLTFGLLHAYQGPLGMVRTALLGFLLAGSLVVTGSLWPAITAHVLLDLTAGLFLGKHLTA